MNTKGNTENKNEYFESHPEAITADDLNNFAQKIEGGLSRTSTLDSSDYQDMSVRSWLKENCDDEEELAEECQFHSERFLDNPQAYFFNELDNVLKELGIKEQVEDLRKRIDELRKNRNEEAKEARYRLSEELNTFLLPVYTRMRELGYSHIDLWK